MIENKRKRFYVGLSALAIFILAFLICVFVFYKEASPTYLGMVLDPDDARIQWSENVLLHVDRNYKTITEVNTTDTKSDSSSSPYKKTMISWKDLVQFLGFEPWNPLEGQNWVTLGNYKGNNLTEFGIINHCLFDCSVPQKGSIAYAYVQSGYYCGNVGITVTSYFGNKKLELSKQGSHFCEEIEIITSPELSENMFDCFLVSKKLKEGISIEIVIGKEGQKISVIKMETDNDPDELKTVYGKICILLGIETGFEKVFVSE